MNDIFCNSVEFPHFVKNFTNCIAIMPNKRTCVLLNILCPALYWAAITLILHATKAHSDVLSRKS
jgi:hypothetical protein